MNINTFNAIKSRFGNAASWAIWKSGSDKDKLTSNMDVDGLFDLSTNVSLLGELRPNIVMVGYNFSVPIDGFPPFHNFHICEENVHHRTVWNASKLRFSFQNTPYWGAYMTDIIKDYVQPDSSQVSVETDSLSTHFQIFREELEMLQKAQDEPNEPPFIIAFGNEVFKLLRDNLNTNEYSQLVQIPHYAYLGNGCANHAEYRQTVLAQLPSIGAISNVGVTSKI